MKIYTAGGWPFRGEISDINNELKSKGLDVISTWIEAETGISTPEDSAKDAVRDVEEIKKCDILLAIMTDEKYAYRGTWFEIGCALALNKKIIIVCPYGETKVSDTKYEYTHYCMTNVFFWHPSITRLKTLNDALSYIA
jgi:nucleoside 2-deoxyribosyltransferase